MTQQPFSDEQGLEYRRVLGHLPTGVVAITADHPDGPVGMACNSFTSVSMSPPLVSFCPAHSSVSWPLIRSVGRFCVNVMAIHHEPVSRQFARSGADKFGGLGYHARPGGPALDDSLAWIDCEIEAEHEAGDHLIVVGRVRAFQAQPDVSPLVFWRGVYGGFHASSVRTGPIPAAAE